MKGRRIYPDKDDGLTFHPGDYGKDSTGDWFCLPPGKDPALGSLEHHTVTEHEDGTITVSPSILITADRDGDFKWHGYLEKGIWREV